MAVLAAAAPFIGAATTALSAYGKYKEGQAAKSAANSKAKLMDEQAKGVEVEAQQNAADERKKVAYIRSRAVALAGASGAGVTDPTITDILTGIDTQGEMNALNIMHSGQTEAAGIRAGAQATRKQGAAEARAGTLGAFTTLAGGALDFYDQNPTFFSKYGGQRARQSIGKGTGYSDFAAMPDAAELVA